MAFTRRVLASPERRPVTADLGPGSSCQRGGVWSSRNPSRVLNTLRDRYGIICGSSKDPNVDMIRIGHMGYVSEAEIDEIFAALAEIMAA